MNFLDAVLNRVTMYKLVIYVLAALLLLAALFGFLGIIHLSGGAILLSMSIFLATCIIVNVVFARTFGAAVHSESAIITALILTLIVSPSLHGHDLVVMVWVSILAMSGKYIVAWKRQHLFNPAALAVAISAVALNASASWWIGNSVLLPFTIVGGYLIVRKLQRVRFTMLFLVTALLATTVSALLRHVSVSESLQEIAVLSPLAFFSTVMLTEPTTMPGRRKAQYLYAVGIGVLYTPQIHIGGIFSTPELSLLTGNFFVFLLHARQRFRLTLVETKNAARDTWDFLFSSDHPIPFRPGQYVELALPHHSPDSRGQRRFFSLASSPDEQYVRMGVKFYPTPSSFKKALAGLHPGSTITAAQLSGDFLLPKDTSAKLVFLAGGIGITPFRSMTADLLARREQRDVVLLYAANSVEDFAYQKLFATAARRIGMRILYAATDAEHAPAGWSGHRGPVDADMIAEAIPDFSERHFYVSGPHGMVLHYEKLLRSIGVQRSRITSDFFPGFA